MAWTFSEALPVLERIRDEMTEAGPDWGSDQAIKKVSGEFKRRAKEPLEVEYIKGSYYGYGSELATLRLWKAYGGGSNKKVDQGYSSNLRTFYFRLGVS